MWREELLTVAKYYYFMNFTITVHTAVFVCKVNLFKLFI